MKKRIAVLISGRGSNMHAIIEACQKPDYPAEVALVISDNPQAAGLGVAQALGCQTHSVDRKQFANKQAFETELHQVLVNAGAIDLVCLAGFMRILSADFVVRWASKLINIHPSLLPAFKGLNTHKRALEAGVKWHGCTVHYVNADVDSGAIIDQAIVPVLPNDTPESLSARVLEVEHPLYVQSITKILTNAQNKVL